MFSRNRYQYARPPRRGEPGCPGCSFLLVSCVLVGWLLVHNGTLTSLMGSISLPTFPLTSGLAFAQPSHQAYSVLGKPSLSPAFVNKVLARAHSPAVGSGQALYDLSVTYGIDDAYALAFFQHESAFGTTGMARVTYSLGNIRCSAGYVCINGYRAYPSWEAGYADWYHLIRTLYVNQWHLMTVSQIIPVYAPEADHNDVAGYIRAVEQAVDAWRRGEVVG